MDYIWLIPLFAVLFAAAVSLTVLLTTRRRVHRLTGLRARDLRTGRPFGGYRGGTSSGSDPASWSDTGWPTYAGHAAHGPGGPDHGWYGSSDPGGSSCSDSGWTGSSSDSGSSSSSSSDSGSSSSSSSDSSSSSC